jgi:5-methylcytosine-specific restriction protein A
VAGVRPPAWRTEESLLALDLYLRPRTASTLSSTAPEVVDLSTRLRKLQIWPGDVRRNPAFRNPAGVALKLHNFAALDPGYDGVGMQNGSEVDRKVWDRWAHRPTELAAVAVRILALATREDLTTPAEDEKDVEAEEGDALYRMHRKIERNRRLVEKKKEQILARTGRLACEVCNFESSERYGPAISVIDVHHIVPLQEIGKSRTKLSDLALVCPTCHRILHAHRPIATPAELRAANWT